MKSVTVSNSTEAKHFFSHKNQCNMGGKRMIFFFFVERNMRNTPNLNAQEEFMCFKDGG